MAIVSVPVVGLSVSLPLTIVMVTIVTMSITMAVVSMTMAIVSIAIVGPGISLSLAIVVEPVSMVSEMAVSVMGVTKVTVSMDESVMSVVSVVSVRRSFCLGVSLGDDCSHQEESDEHNGLHICGCEQARDPSRTPH